MKRSVGSHRSASWGARTLRAGAAVGVLAAVGATTVVPALSAQAATGKSQRVVQVVTRAPFGQMLATVKGASLYTTASSCTGTCLKVWPPLLMGKGKTMPTGVGVTGLGTTPVTVKGAPALQVTYHGSALYRFVSDSGTSVNGDGVGGFTVAHL